MAEEPMSQAKQVRGIYSIMNGIENNIGGGEGIQGLYGSITGSHMQRMFAVMKEHCGFNTSSHLVDIGSGLGRPLLHAIVTEGISGATGIELDFIKCMKADAFLKQTAKAMVKRGFTEHAITLPVIECKPVEKVRSLDPATHAYSFWEGVPIDARVAFGRLFAGSKTLRSVTVVQRSMRFEDPEEVMEHGYAFGPVTLVETLSVSMSGSNRHFTAYIFNKSEPAVPLPRRRGAKAARAAEAEVEMEVAEIEDRSKMVVTPPPSGDTARMHRKASNRGLDAVSKKLDLAQVAVASPAAGSRDGAGGSGSNKNDNKSRAGRPSKKRKEVEIETAPTVIMTTKQKVVASPQKKAKQAPITTRSSPRKEKKQPCLAALIPRRRVHVDRNPQQSQQKKQQKHILTVTYAGVSKQTNKNKSPQKIMSREARGLLGGGGGGGSGLFGAAELLEGSAYPRTRHALSLIS